MNTSYFLEIDIGEYNSTIQRMAFETKEDAMAQLALIEPLLGHGKFRNDPEKNRHRVVGPDGEMVVVVEHVRMARVIDRATYDALADYAYRKDADRDSEHIVKIAAATLYALQKDETPT